MNKIVLILGLVFSSSFVFGQALIIPRSIPDKLDIPNNLHDNTIDFESPLGHIVSPLESNISDNNDKVSDENGNTLGEDSNMAIIDLSKDFSSKMPVKEFSKDFPSRMPMLGNKPIQFGIQLEGIKK
jgi:hypothetical protein